MLTMKIDILTLFPEMFKGPFSISIIKRAQDRSLVEIKVHNLRDWAEDKHKTVDDRPFGGGVGMILKIDVIDRAVYDLKYSNNLKGKTQESSKDKTITKTKVILLDAGGKKFTQKEAVKISIFDHLIIICGHYEGVDFRVHTNIADETYSIGDYIMTGGEIPAMVLTDSVVRLIPGVLDKSDATKNESFQKSKYLNIQMLEHPQYTRPEKYFGWNVPKVLMSGNHKEIEKWKQQEALAKTKKVRPELLKI